ncbi:caspase family protein [Tardiphaga sp. vice154]|uniref:caspase family protein n=1 Tax=Tardiphaga sp. vice154 TaxID=2592814 RepID=UPI00116595B6|nr:caspase family protein [Tardiphaga sp. vice154]QDM21386.1 caspase family protein [Tardiphaga sp. vice154]
MVRSVLRPALLAAALLINAPAGAENRIALVIGQSAYRAVTPLPNPVNDARAMAQMLGDAGFEVQSASDLGQNELRARIGAFAASVAEKGPDTVSLVFYAGHGLQIDGENYLVPVDVDPKREADIPLQAVRLNDILNTLTSVPSRTRIILLDACRNNPFPGINKTTGRGLAHVDVKLGTAGTLLSFSTSPGAEAEDGSGGNSPYTAALLKAGREPNLAIEDAFKRVRLSVNLATEGRQTPWESSSLVSDFRFFGSSVATAAVADAKPSDSSTASDSRTAEPKITEAKASDAKASEAKASESMAAAPKPAKRTADEWRRQLQGKKVEQANELIVADGSVEAYEAFVALYAQPPLGPQAREWLDRHYKMVAWNNAVITNTASSYAAFLAKYPDSDLTPTAKKLEDRTRNRTTPVAATGLQPIPVALAAPACPCGAPGVAPIKANLGKPALPKPEPKKKKQAEPDRRADRSPPRLREIDEVVVVRRTPVYVPSPGISIGGYGYRGGFNRGGGGYSGNSGGRGRY